MNKTKIEWSDSTWNPVTGCLHKCPYCYATDNNTSFIEGVAAEFDYMGALYDPEGTATLEYDRTCEGCGKRYHLSVDATVKMYFTTTCETEDDEPTEDDMMREAMIGVY